MSFKRAIFGFLLFTLTLLALGCADHNTTSNTTSRTDYDTTSRLVSGYASKGIIASGIVTAYKLDADGKKLLPMLAQARTNNAGFYSMRVGSYFGPLSVEVSGRYTDEATGQVAVISADNPLMAAIVPPVDATPVTINITGLTEIAYAHAKTLSGGLTRNINAINSLVSKSFLVDNILTTSPLDASTTLPLSATDFEKQYTLVLAAISQIAAGNLQPGTATPTTVQLADALATALSDLRAQLPANSTASVYTLRRTVAFAALAFLAGSNNHTGLTQADPSIQTLLVAARTVSGYASKGIIKNGTVTAYKIAANGTKILPKLAQTTTGDSGYYSISIGAYYGPLIIEVSGAYTDESTGQPAVIDASAPLTAAVMPPNDATPITINVTALTQVAVNLAQTQQAGFTSKINALNQQVSNIFQVPDILTTTPLDTSALLPATASAGEKQYTLALAAISQIAANSLPVVTTPPTTTQLANALSATLKTLSTQIPTSGTATTVQITIAGAAAQFVNNTAVNTSGITASDPAVQQILSASTRKNSVITIAVNNPVVSVPSFGAVHGSVTLPVGMVCPVSNSNGELESSSIAALQTNSLVSGNFNSESRVLTIQAINANGLAKGDLLAVTCNAPSTSTAQISDFIINSAALDVNDGGASLPGFSLVVTAAR